VVLKPKYNKKQNESSKVSRIHESVLIWIMTISLIILAFHCITNQYFGELPWLAAMVGFPWTAYGVSQACYYKKAEKENIKNGIKYETIMASIATNDEECSKDEPNSYVPETEAQG
jgi:hypothetical protein